MMLDAAAMKRLSAACVMLMLVALTACTPKDIHARDYDQSCAVDDDCVAVSELEANGTDCSFACTQVAINKKEKARFDEDLEDSRDNCGSSSAQFCESSGRPACVQSRCTVDPR